MKQEMPGLLIEKIPSDHQIAGLTLMALPAIMTRLEAIEFSSDFISNKAIPNSWRIR